MWLAWHDEYGVVWASMNGCEKTLRVVYPTHISSHVQPDASDKAISIDYHPVNSAGRIRSIPQSWRKGQSSADKWNSKFQVDNIRLNNSARDLFWKLNLFDEPVENDSF